MNVTDLTALEIRDQIVTGGASAAEVTTAFLERIEELEPKVHAFLDCMADQALERARQLDRRRARGEAPGALHGVPIAVKDNISIRGVDCTCASRILEGYIPPYDATVLQRLLAQGAIVMGKTNLDEFSMGSSTENSAFPSTRNPWDLERVPGGSSGGSAAAVAAHQVPLALGTDTGGSIRQPAAMCGVAGLKPTYGRVSRYGLIAYASSLDQIGPLSRSVQDLAALLGVIAGHDPLDPTSSREPTQDYPRQLDGKVKFLRLGIPNSFGEEGLHPDVMERFRSAISTLEALGVEPVEIELTSLPQALASYYILATAEASSNLARYDGVRYGLRASPAQDMRTLYCRTRRQGLGAEAKRRILLGTYVLSAGYYDAYYLKAQKVRTLITEQFHQILQRVDAVALPTTPTPAFRLGERLDDPLQMYLSDIFTIIASLVGAPAISIPVGFSRQRLPVGLQLLGRHFDEVTLLRLAHAFEQATDFHRRHPPLS